MQLCYDVYLRLFNTNISCKFNLAKLWRINKFANLLYFYFTDVISPMQWMYKPINSDRTIYSYFISNTKLKLLCKFIYSLQLCYTISINYYCIY